MAFLTFVLVSLLLLAACDRAPQLLVSTPSTNEWNEFNGTWNCAGSRSVMQLGHDRRVSILDLDGSLLLAGRSRPAVGFRAHAMVFNDSSTGMVGRAVWTDEHGDQAYSELRGEGSATDNKIVGTFVGGTGRYANAEGTYEFSWQYVLETEDGTVQGQSIGLKGRVRVVSQPALHDTGVPRS